MATLNRSSVSLWIQRLLNLQPGSEAVPRFVKTDIQPVAEVNPKYANFLMEAESTSSAASGNFYTTPTGKDFYLTHAFLCMTKDAASDNTEVALTVVINGKVTSVLAIHTQSLVVANNHSAYLSFPYPILLDRGSAVGLSGTFTTGTMTKFTSIGGFILE